MFEIETFDFLTLEIETFDFLTLEIETFDFLTLEIETFDFPIEYRSLHLNYVFFVSLFSLDY